jgi:tRNA A-37 threonylcarbamoyl transferase component Bud32
MQPSVVHSSIIGQSLGGKYRVEAEIGQGGFGVVYRATHLGLGKPRAVKILRHLGDDWRKRFDLEGRALAELDHPYIVAVVDVGVMDEGNPYIVMEYVEGSSLGSLIKAEGMLSLQRALGIMRCVCSAVHYAHERGIIHRDLKPSNIIVQPLSGEGDIAKVLDFGLAKFLQSPSGESLGEPLTQTGIILGTMEYLSPEQCAGKGVDERSDIYALGVILYQMLTGTVPFTGESPLAILTQHLHTPPPSLRDSSPTVPAAVEWVISRALQKDPGQRQQTALQLRQELETAILHPEQIPVDETIEIHLSGTSLAKELLLRWRRRLLQPKWMAVVVVAVALLGTLFALQFGRRTGPPPWVITDPAGWRDEFASNVGGRPLEKFWNAPPEWIIVPGQEGSDGVLLVQGPKFGTLRPRQEGMTLYDFYLKFGVTHIQGSRIVWTLRSQGPKEYYLFDLTFPKDESGQGAQFQGYVCGVNGPPRPFSPYPKMISEFGPPQKGDRYWIEVEAQGYTFYYKFSRDSDSKDRILPDQNVQIEPDPQDQLYQYGTIGFGGLAETEAVQIEYVHLLRATAPSNTR